MACRTNKVPAALPEVPQRLCINCDNRHGCRTPRPLCEDLVPGPDERRLPGRLLMQRRGLLATCRLCSHFRRCWQAETYRRLLGSR